MSITRLYGCRRSINYINLDVFGDFLCVIYVHTSTNGSPGHSNGFPLKQLNSAVADATELWIAELHVHCLKDPVAIAKHTHMNTFYE